MSIDVHFFARSLACLFFILFSFLTACGISGPETPSPAATLIATREPTIAATPTEREITPTATQEPELEGVVTLWHAWNETETQALVEVIAKFREIHPKVLFDVRYVPFDELIGKYQADAELGHGPNVLIGPAEWGPSLFDKNLIQDISALIPSELLGSINQAALGEVRYRGVLIGVPYSIQGVLLFRNKNIIEESPITYDEFITVSQNASRGGHVGAYLDRGIFFSAAHLNGIGGLLADENGNPAFNNEKGIDWLRLLKSFEEAGLVEFNGNQDVEFFKEGRVGLIIDGSWNTSVLANAIGNDSLAIDPWPIDQDGHLSGYVQTENLYLNVNVWEADRLASITFIEFFLDPETQAALSKTGFIPSVPNTRVTDPLIQQAMTAFSMGTPYPILPDFDVYWQPLEEALASVFEGGIDPAVALQQAQEVILTRLEEAR